MSKPVISVSDDGTITEYPSVTAAAKAVGVAQSQISVACNTHWKCVGLRWYIKGEEPSE